MTDFNPTLAEAEAAIAALVPDEHGFVEIAGWCVETVMGEYRRRGEALDRIAEAHSKNIDSAGGTWGDCVECGWSWPCPTHVWATTRRDVFAPWMPADDQEAGNE